MDFNESEFLPQEWLIELGKITQSWVNFEMLLNLLLGKLAGFDQPFETIPSILITHSSFPQRLDMFAALCESKLPDYPKLANYREVLILARTAQSSRNKFTHNQIGVAGCAPGHGQVGKVSARGKLKQELEAISLDDLRKTTNLIVEAGRAMCVLVLASEN